MAFDSLLARDLVVNDLTYRWASLTIQDAASLANNVLDAYETELGVGKFPQTTAKVYDLEGTKPVLPMATVTRRPGTVLASSIPREVALCLSFSGGQHQPRQRGRIYVPMQLVGGVSSLRPTTAMLATLRSFGNALYGVGGANVDWIVWSRVNRSATSVSRHWIDDEWDIQRRRGLRPTTRNQADH
jgi:hypothetical protein